MTVFISILLKCRYSKACIIYSIINDRKRRVYNILDIIKHPLGNIRQNLIKEKSKHKHKHKHHKYIIIQVTAKFQTIKLAIRPDFSIIDIYFL